MKNRFLWILCVLLSLLVLTGGCNRKPASTADVPRSLSHQYKIAVAPFTQPRDISQLIMGQLPQPQALAARDVLIAQDRQLRDVLYTTTKRSYDFLPRTRPLPDLKRFHTSERPQALPLWVEYARKTSADILFIPQVLTWRDRQGSAAGVTEPAHVRLEFFLLNIKDGSILAAATYPSFDASRYNKDYKKLAKDKLNPLFNRALLGIYAPGSTYKMCTAAAGVETGAINVATTHYECKGSMTYYGHTYHCWETRGQGTEYLADAVRDSCNIFFYNVGINTGIKALTKKAQEYGLGEATGVELSESIGVNAGPAYSEKMGALWTDGNTLMAAIGQSDNQFSPLQLANYVATLINGGDRYKAHLLKTVKSSDNSKILYQYEPEVVKKVPLEQDAYDAIKKGMGEVIEADKIKEFDNLQDRGIKVGCKTGTAEVGTARPKLYNALLVSFAPYDNPEIAVCTVVEKSPSQGASTAAITAAIMEYYFSEDAVQERVAAENKLVS